MKIILLSIMLFAVSAASAQIVSGSFGSRKSRAVHAEKKEETVRVKVNREARTKQGRMTIRFVEFIEDSRCPIGTTCIWAGNAKIKVRLKRGNHAARVIEMNTNGPNTTVTYAGYKVTLTDLKPQPAENVRINPSEYTATFSISK